MQVLLSLSTQVGILFAGHKHNSGRFSFGSDEDLKFKFEEAQARQLNKAKR